VNLPLSKNNCCLKLNKTVYLDQIKCNKEVKNWFLNGVFSGQSSVQRKDKLQTQLGQSLHQIQTIQLFINVHSQIKNLQKNSMSLLEIILVKLFYIITLIFRKLMNKNAKNIYQFQS
jgi:hypothetical protein